MRRPTYIRVRGRRLAAALAVVAAVATVAAGCGGESSTPADAGSEPAALASFVPAGSPAYVEVSTDIDGEQWQQVIALAQKFPSYPRLQEQIQRSLSEEGIDFERDVKPLLGDRAVVAALRAPADAGTVTDSDSASGALDESGYVAAVEIAEGREQNVRELLVTNGAERQERDGVEYFTDDDSASAVTEQTLVVADTPEDLFLALEAQEAGGERTLAGDSRFTEAIGELPGDTFAQGYIDVGGFMQNAAASSEQRDQLQNLGISDFDEAAVAMALTAEEEGLRFRGVLTGAPESATAATEFGPELLDNVPADAIAYIGLADLAGQIERLIDRVRSSGGEEVGQQIDAFGAQLPQLLPGVTVEELAALARGEHAVVVSEGAAGSSMPGAGAVLGVDDEEQARATLDEVRAGLPNLASSLGAGTLPPWREVPLAGGVQGWELPLSEDAAVVYGVTDGKVFLGSSAAQVQRLQEPGELLSESSEWQAGASDVPEQVTSVVWLNIDRGVAALDAAGALEDADAETRANLEPVKSLVAWSTDGETPAFETFVRITD